MARKKPRCPEAALWGKTAKKKMIDLDLTSVQLAKEIGRTSKYVSLVLGDYKATGMAITYLMQTSRYEPKVADIREKVREITEGPSEEVLEEQTAWNLVWRCVTGLDWNNPAEKYNRLPELIRRCVDLPMIISWAQMDEGEVQSVARSHFRASYQAMARREREDARISPRLKQEILSIALNRQEALTGGTYGQITGV